jgi:hypothetical protein
MCSVVRDDPIHYNVPRGCSFSEHLAIERMGGRHTPIPLQFHAHGLKITSISLRTLSRSL